MVVVIAASVAGCARSTAPTVELPCCRDSQYQMSTVAADLRAKCPTDSGHVAFDLTQTHIRRTFRCRAVRQAETEVETRLAASVATRNDAGRRADRIVSIAHSLGVNQEPRNELVWLLGTSTSDYGCDRAGDVTFRRNEIADAAHNGEDATHWLKVEAAYIAGACPKQLDLLYRTVIAAGAPDAVATVRSELDALK